MRKLAALSLLCLTSLFAASGVVQPTINYSTRSIGIKASDTSNFENLVHYDYLNSDHVSNVDGGRFFEVDFKKISFNNKHEEINLSTTFFSPILDENKLVDGLNLFCNSNNSKISLLSSTTRHFYFNLRKLDEFLNKIKYSYNGKTNLVIPIIEINNKTYYSATITPYGGLYYQSFNCTASNYLHSDEEIFIKLAIDKLDEINSVSYLSTEREFEVYSNPFTSTYNIIEVTNVDLKNGSLDIYYPYYYQENGTDYHYISSIEYFTIAASEANGQTTYSKTFKLSDGDYLISDNHLQSNTFNFFEINLSDDINLSDLINKKIQIYGIGVVWHSNSNYSIKSNEGSLIESGYGAQEFTDVLYDHYSPYQYVLDSDPIAKVGIYEAYSWKENSEWWENRLGTTPIHQYFAFDFPDVNLNNVTSVDFRYQKGYMKPNPDDDYGFWGEAKESLGFSIFKKEECRKFFKNTSLTLTDDEINSIKTSIFESGKAPNNYDWSYNSSDESKGDLIAYTPQSIEILKYYYEIYKIDLGIPKSPDAKAHDLILKHYYWYGDEASHINAISPIRLTYLTDADMGTIEVRFNSKGYGVNSNGQVVDLYGQIVEGFHAEDIGGGVQVIVDSVTGEVIDSDTGNACVDSSSTLKDDLNDFLTNLEDKINNAPKSLWDKFVLWAKEMWANFQSSEFYAICMYCGLGIIIVFALIILVKIWRFFFPKNNYYRRRRRRRRW